MLPKRGFTILELQKEGLNDDVESQSQSKSPSPEPLLKMNLSSTMAKIPSRKTKASAGLDLSSLFTKVIDPHQTRVIQTGIKIQIPKGHMGLVTDKSSIALYNNLHVLGGVLDEDFRGEIKVLMHNLSSEAKTIDAGYKFAQLLIIPISRPSVKLTSTLDHTDRSLQPLLEEDQIQDCNCM